MKSKTHSAAARKARVRLRPVRAATIVSCALLAAQAAACKQSTPANTPTEAARVETPTGLARRSTTPTRSVSSPFAFTPRPSAAPPGGRNPDAPFTVEVDADPDIGQAPLTVHFAARVEGGSGLLTYEWDFGDGGHDTQNPTTYTYEAAGAYTAVLVVRNDDGRAARGEVGIQVDGTEDTEAEGPPAQ